MSVERIGIVGCETSESRALQRVLVRHGYLADAMDATADIVAYCRGVCPIALILNIDCDRESALDLICSLHAESDRPLIVATGSSATPHGQVDSLGRGADDFIAQPVQPAELIERLGILLGRETSEMLVEVLGSRVQQALTTTEQDILASLQEVMPQTLTREQIMWDIRRQRIAPDDRTLDVYISHIRKKLNLIHADVAIETVRGKGFRLVERHATHRHQPPVEAFRSRRSA